MKPPIFVREPSKKERERIQAGLRSKDAFVMRRCQILLASARGESPLKIARSLGCASQTVRNAIRAFNGKRAGALRQMLHRSPRVFGRESSLWTLEMVADVAFEEGLTTERVSGETIRATLLRLLRVRWMRAKRWITSADPLYERKKG